MTLDACGNRFEPGHKLRLSLSTSYWPMILPPPTDPGLTVDTASISLAMPKLGAADRIEKKEPENPSPLPDYIEHHPGATRRAVTRELSAARTDYVIHEDT